MQPLTAAHIAAKVAGLRHKYPDSSLIAFRAAAGWAGPPRLRIGDEEIDVVQCRSALEVREQLSRHADSSQPLILVTALDESSLGDDVVARFAQHRLYDAQPWAAVRELFRARMIDPRLSAYPWMAEALLASTSPEGPPVAPGGVLSLDVAWGILLERLLGLANARPDAEPLLRWTASPDANRFVGLRTEVRDALRSWVGECAGHLGALIMGCVAAGHGRDALPIGLACGVVFDTDGIGDVKLAQGAVRLERFAGNEPIAPDTGRRWAAAAEEILLHELATGSVDVASRWIDRVDTILAELGAAGEAYRSRFSRAGLEQRLTRYAAALNARAGNVGGLARLAEAASAARAHELIRLEPERALRLRMSERLSRWVAGAPTSPTSLADAALRYARQGSFADWARIALRGGDPSAELSAAYGRLYGDATERAEDAARALAMLLRGWLEADSRGIDVLSIEDVLDRVVAPLASRVPVLLIVLDGMSFAVFDELAADLVAARWEPLRPTDAEEHALALSAPPVIAAVPTLTEVSRASLLCGRLASGGQRVEKQGFASHLGLLAVSKKAAPPLLFHKGELIDKRETDLADAVRAAIAAADTRVIGVVLNAVDDFLLKSDQIRPRWRADDISLLRPLLAGAAEAGRAVVITSDHGHVLDSGADARAIGQSDRWRLDNGQPGGDELVLAGRRVAAEHGGRVIAPWSERVRYGGKKNGYHGGANPQEVIVPLGVFAAGDLAVDGWLPTSIDVPDWWEAEVGAAARSAAPAAPTPRPRRRTVAGQPDLFEPPSTTPKPAATWIDALLGSEVFAAQKAAAARIAPPDDRICTFLQALDERGGRLTRAALAQKLALPPLRVQTMVAAMRRLLNVEGYDVLAVNETSETLELNLELLKVQFEIR